MLKLYDKGVYLLNGLWKKKKQLLQRQVKM